MQIESHCHEKALWICVHPCLMACDANPGLQKKLTQEFITETSREDSGGHQLGERSQSKAHSQATQQGTHGFVLKPHPRHTHTHTMQAHSCTQMLFPNSPCRYRSMQHIVGQLWPVGVWWMVVIWPSSVLETQVSTARCGVVLTVPCKVTAALRWSFEKAQTSRMSLNYIKLS